MVNENEENNVFATEKLLLKPFKGTLQNVVNLKSEVPRNTLCISNLKENENENELLTLFKSYGTILQIFISNDVALVEFDRVETVSNLVSISRANTFKINNHKVDLSFSCQSIDECKSLLTPNITRSSGTKVLHFLITNVLYDITVDVLKQICSPYGQIVRICVGIKNRSMKTVEALIEFDSELNAQSVKENLDGHDIYSNCCTLLISYSKIHKIFVQRNDSYSFDYSIIKKSAIDLSPTLYDKSDTEPLFDKGPLNISSTSPMYYMTDGTSREVIEGVVLECKNFSSRLKAINFFNLFCIYGNVVKVKLAKEEPKIALIQMSNREAAYFCKEMFNGLTMFNETIEITTTTLTHLTDISPNDDPVTSFDNDIYKRFKSTYQGRNYVYRPSEILYFFNVPWHCSVEQITEVFISAKVACPCKVIILRKFDSSHLKSSLVTGLINFDSIEHAVEAVSMVNHQTLFVPGISHPYHLKLAFKKD